MKTHLTQAHVDLLLLNYHSTSPAGAHAQDELEAKTVNNQSQLNKDCFDRKWETKYIASVDLQT